MIAALFVYADGPYSTIPDVEIWTESCVQQSMFNAGVHADARNYTGAHPVVAHPPCSRWCRLAGLVEARWGYKRGEDGGAFESAVRNVRRCGGVLEHPAYSDAFDCYGLPIPARAGGWTRGKCGGFSCHVEQGRYGHVAKKATWLYAFGCELPSLKWGSVLDCETNAPVSWCGNKVKSGEKRPRVGSSRAASETPAEFRGVLLTMARSVSSMAVAS